MRLFCSAVLCIVVTIPCQAATRPNVLLIISDDLQAELGCYGSAAKTPNLDAFATKSLRFDHMYCQQSVCNPSRSSFLTGLRPDTLHLWVNGTHFRAKNPDVITLPQTFKQNGYETRCVGKVFHNWHTTPKGDRRSWSADEFLHYANHGEDVAVVEGKLPANQALPIGRVYGSVPLCECRDVPDEAYFDGRVAVEAVKQLSEIKSKPFFLAVGFWKPHAPFNAPKKYWDLYNVKQLPPLDPRRAAGTPEIAYHDSREILGLGRNRIEPSAAQMTEMRHGYYANISYMDAQVGKVLAALDTSGQRENTIVVFLSDHGYHLGEQQLWGKTSCFERDARVPFIVRTPHMKTAGTSINAPAELIDLFPTLTDLCSLKNPTRLEGVSLVPLLNGTQNSVKGAAFTQHPRPAYADRTPSGLPDAMGYSVRQANTRYTEWRDWATGKLIGAEFYDFRRKLDAPRNQFEESKDAPELAAARKALHSQFPPAIPPAKR